MEQPTAADPGGTVTPAVITEQEFAALLRVHPETARRWRSDGLGPRPIHAGGRLVRYRRVDVDAWIAAGGVAGADRTSRAGQPA